MTHRSRICTWVLVWILVCASVGMARAREPGWRIADVDGRLTFENALYSLELAYSDGVSWGAIRNLSIPEDKGRAFLDAREAGRVFEVTLVRGEDRTKLTSLDFTGTNIAVGETGTCSFELRPKDEQVPLVGGLRISIDDSCQSVWSFSFTCPEDAVVDFVFPIIEGIEMGSEIEDMGYFFPREPGLMNHVPIKLATNYGQYAQTQLVSVFNDRWGENGGGLYYFIEDTSLRRKSFELEKRDPGGAAPLEGLDEYGFPFWKDFKFDRGIGVASAWPHIPLKAGIATRIAPVAIGIHPGNWRKAFRDYRMWVDTWYEVERFSGFQKVFAFHSFNLFDKRTPEEAREAVPLGVDLLHFMVQAKHVNGEYGYREDWRLKGIREFTGAMRQQGTLVSHYLEGYIASKSSRVYGEHGPEWGQKQADGSNVVAFANMAMCLAAEGWTDFLVATAKRLVNDLEFDVIYLDEVGFGTGDKYVCHNPNHDHPGPYLGMTSIRRMFEKVRKAIREVRQDAVLTTEGPVVDLWYPHLDGNEGYGVRAYQKDIYGPPIHFMRFLYPDFKYIDLRIGTAEEQRLQMKQILFNGTAADMDPADHETFDAMAASIFHENVDAFTDPSPVPHVPTRQPGLYCNRFSARDKVLYTLWNDNDYPLSGAFIPLDIPADAHLVELIRKRELPTARVDHQAHVVVGVDAKDVAVVAVLPERIPWELHGMYATIDWDSVDGELLAVRLDEENRERSQLIIGPPVHAPEGDAVRAGPFAVELAPEGPWADGALNLVEFTERGTYRPALKLLRDGNLADEAVLPELGAIDLAAFAEATAVDTGKDHGRHPESVIRAGGGNWEFRWDDEPRPGWVQLEWQRPQTFNNVRMRFSKGVYSSRDYELQRSEDGEDWQSILRTNTDVFVTDDRFEPVTARYLRVVFHQGGPWGNLVQLNKLHVFFTPKHRVDFR